MTLTVRTKPPKHHKKLSGKHHRYSKNYHKAYWPYLPLLAIVVVGFFLNSTLPGKRSVLGYATDMSIQSLLDDTNAQRTANSEASLTLNTKLDSAAQAKASDMAARDYWSHNTPDGQTPWSFMTAAGYNYQLAGENLAYGFATASDTLTGWMNSPEHRANILNAGYQEVGFGFINIANYQSSGPETLVVAMYGTPANSAPVAAVAPPSTHVSSSAPAAPSAGAAVAPTTSPAPAPPTAASTLTNSSTLTPVSSIGAKQQTQLVTEPKAQDISRVELLTAGKAPWSMFVLSLVGSSALLVFLLRHGLAWHKVLVKGERFFVRHPVLDVALVSLVTLSFVLARSSGVIR
jgi:uncharacterized protein YkwD